MFQFTDKLTAINDSREFEKVIPWNLLIWASTEILKSSDNETSIIDLEIKL